MHHKITDLSVWSQAVGTVSRSLFSLDSLDSLSLLRNNQSSPSRAKTGTLQTCLSLCVSPCLSLLSHCLSSLSHCLVSLLSYPRRRPYYARALINLSRSRPGEGCRLKGRGALLFRSPLSPCVRGQRSRRGGGCAACPARRAKLRRDPSAASFRWSWWGWPVSSGSGSAWRRF